MTLRHETCPDSTSKVIETRAVVGATYRRRRCDACGETWATVEKPFSGPIPVRSAPREKAKKQAQQRQLDHVWRKSFKK